VTTRARYVKLLLDTLEDLVMRLIAIAAAAAALSAAPAANAAPAAIHVAVGPELQAKAERVYGVREVRDLAEQLRRLVARRLANSDAYDNARIELVLTDAVPNRPTFKQLSDVPGLSSDSFGVGGAAIEGRIVAPDGQARPLAYRYYETDIRYARHVGTWSDAQWALQQFADKLARGDAYARR
jgi:hypothetical protein